MQTTIMPGVSLNTFIQSEAGSKTSDDRALALSLGQGGVIVLADGASGMSGGAEAAEVVVEAARKAAESGSLRAPEDCMRILRAADTEAEEHPVAGISTGVLAVVTEESVFGASVGDSKAWWFGNDSESFEDLTANQIRKPFLGTGRARPVSFSMPIEAGVLLVASDGLMDYGKPDEIQAVVRGSDDLEQAARALIELVMYPWGKLPDDVTVALCRVKMD